MKRREAYFWRTVLVALLVLIVLGVRTCVRSCRGHSAPRPAAPAAKAQPRVVDDSLRSRLARFGARHEGDSLLAFALYDLTADTSVYALHADALMPTASCQKLLTGLAALHRVGSNYYYATRLFLDGRLQGDTLLGNVYLKGGFDPLLTEAELRPLARRLRAAGVRHVAGRVVLDVMVSERPEPEAHWKPWDIKAARYGVLFQGTERLGRALRRNLAAAGVDVRAARVECGRTPAHARAVGSVARPMSEALGRMWRNSSNICAESMLYQLGYSWQGGGDLRRAGLEYLRRFVCSELGRRDSCHALHDGCGLCPQNSMTASLLVGLMRYAYHRPRLYAALMDALPTAGRDGTLRREMTRSPARGNVRAKTGTLTVQGGISSLTGYCTGASGHRYAFAILCNHTPVADARVLQNRLCTEFVK